MSGRAGLESGLRDARLALRVLRRSPMFTFASAGTLALAIGATTAIYTVVQAVLLRPSPFPDPDRLVMLWETDRASGTVREPASWPDVVDFSERSRALAEVGSMVGIDAMVGGDDGVGRLSGLAVTPGFLEAVGVQPLVGRSFAADDFASGGGGPAILLGEGYWRSALDADPDVVGRSLTVNDAPAEVVGVLPREADLGVNQIHQRADYSAPFAGGEVAIWFALLPDGDGFPRSTHPFLTVARLAPGVAVADAQTELSGIAADLESVYPENQNRGVNVASFSEEVFGPVRAALRVLLGAVLVVLLIACANVANLLLARTVTRSREVSLRRAIGAGTAQLRRQFLVEAAMLTGLGTLAGIGLAYVSLDALLAVAPADIPRLATARIDGAVLALPIGLGLAITLVLGFLPGLQTGKVDAQGSLKAQPGRRASEGRELRALRSALIIGEIALAVTLAVGAGVLLRSFRQLSGVDPGFRSAQVMTVEYRLPEPRYSNGRNMPDWPDVPQVNGFHAQLLERVRGLPGVDAAAVAGFHPLDPGFTNSFVIVGREDELGSYPEIRVRYISPGYTETLGTRLLSGRDVGDGDVAGAPMVTLINRAAAERYFADSDPLGQSLRWWGITRRVVGVIEDERFLGLDTDPAPAAYLPLAQSASMQGTLLLRASTDPSSLLPAIRGQLRELDPEVPLFDPASLEASLAGSVSQPRFASRLLTMLGVVALALALIGVQGMLSYSVAQRLQEVGIRMALGADRSSITRAVLGEGLKLTVAGLTLGVLCALAASGLLRGLVYGVTPTDPATYIIVVVAVLAAALSAMVVPALRASRVDPLTALRAE